MSGFTSFRHKLDVPRSEQMEKEERWKDQSILNELLNEYEYGLGIQIFTFSQLFLYIV